jgi:hypothetical protein
MRTIVLKLRQSIEKDKLERVIENIILLAVFIATSYALVPIV